MGVKLGSSFVSSASARARRVKCNATMHSCCRIMLHLDWIAWHLWSPHRFRWVVLRSKLKGRSEAAIIGD